jgi:hypothetical protein
MKSVASELNQRTQAEPLTVRAAAADPSFSFPTRCSGERPRRKVLMLSAIVAATAIFAAPDTAKAEHCRYSRGGSSYSSGYYSPRSYSYGYYSPRSYSSHYSYPSYRSYGSYGYGHYGHRSYGHHRSHYGHRGHGGIHFSFGGHRH